MNKNFDFNFSICKLVKQNYKLFLKNESIILKNLLNKIHSFKYF